MKVGFDHIFARVIAESLNRTETRRALTTKSYRPTRAQRGMPDSYSPQEEDRKHNFVRRKFRNARGER